MAVRVTIVSEYNGKAVKTAVTDLESFKKAVARAGGGISGTFDAAGQYIAGVGRKVSDTGKSMSRNITLPMLAAGGVAVKAFMDVDDALDSVAIQTGATGKQLAQFQGIATKLAGKVPADLDQIAAAVSGVHDGLELTGRPLQQVSRQMIDLARVTGTDTSVAVTSLTRAMNDAGVSAKDSGKFLDMLLTTSQQTKIGVTELADKMVKFGSPMRQLGFDAKSTAALLGSFQKSGVNTDLVMGSLRIGLGKLAKAGEKDLPAALRSSIAEIKNAKTSGEAAAKAMELFGSRAGADMAAAIREGRFEVGDLMKALDKSGGALKRTKKDTDGAAEQFKVMQNQIKLAAADLGAAIVPALQAVVPVVQKVVAWFSGLSDQTKKLIVIVGGVAAAVGPLVVVLGAVVTAAGTVMSALAAITLPAVAVVAAIAAVVVALVLLWRKSEAFRSAVLGVWESVKKTVLSVVANVRKALDDNRSSIETLKSAFAKIASFIANTVAPIIVKLYGLYLKMLIKEIGLVITWLIKIIGWWVQFARWMVNAEKAVASFAVAAVKWIGKAVAVFVSLPLRVQAAVANAATWLVRTGVAAVVGLWNGVKSKAAWLKAQVATLGTKVKNAVSDAGSWLVDTGVNIAIGLWNGIKSKAGWLKDQIIGWAKSVIPDPIEKFLDINSPSRKAAYWGHMIGEGLIVGLLARASAVAGASRRLGVKALEGLKAATEKMKDKVGDQLDKLRDRYAAFRDAVAAKIDDLKQDMTDAVEALKQSRADLREALTEKFADELDKITAKFGALKDAAQEALDDAQQRFEDVTAQATEFRRSITDALNIGLDSTEGSAAQSFAAAIAQGQEFMKNLQALRDAGLNATSLQQILAKGVEQGNAIASSILGEQSVGTINELQATYDAQVQQFADLWTGAEFDQVQAQAQGAVTAAQAALATIVAAEQAEIARVNAQQDAILAAFDKQTASMLGSLQAQYQAQIDVMQAQLDYIDKIGQKTGLLADKAKEWTIKVGDNLKAVADRMAKLSDALKDKLDDLDKRIRQLAAQISAAEAAQNDKGKDKPKTAAARIASAGAQDAASASSLASTTSSSFSTTSSSRQVTIAPGAVQVSIAGEATATSSGLADTVKKIVDEALVKLAREVERA